MHNWTTCSASLAGAEDFKTGNTNDKIYCIEWNVLQNLNFVFAIFAILPSILIKINISQEIQIPLWRSCFHPYNAKKKNFPAQKVRRACKKFLCKSLGLDSPICILSIVWISERPSQSCRYFLLMQLRKETLRNFRLESRRFEPW